MINVGTEYYFGKGKVALCERDANGGISQAIYAGNCPELKFSSSAEKLQHFESMSGNNLQDREIIKSLSMEMSVTLEDVKDDILALLVWGAVNDIASAAAQSHFFPNPVANGEIHVVPNAFGLTVPVLKDSAATPATVDAADYNIDTDFGVVEFLDVSGYTQPFELEYTRGAGVGIPFFTGSRPARFLRFEGQNLANPGTSSADKWLVEIYNIGFDPPADLSFIGEEFGKFELKGSVQKDDTRADNSALGGYVRVIKF